MTEVSEVDRRQARRFDMEHVVGLILQLGVLLSMTLIVAGYAWRWMKTGYLRLDYQIAATNLFQFWRDDLRDAIAGLWRPRLLVNLGIAILMATPYFRVFVSMLHFGFVQRNVKYTVFTLFVLSILTYSLFFGVPL